LALRHCGQLLKAGLDKVQADARLLLDLDLEVFFFGTAILPYKPFRKRGIYCSTMNLLHDITFLAGANLLMVTS